MRPGGCHGTLLKVKGVKMGITRDWAVQTATSLTGDPAKGHNKIVMIFRLIFSAAFFGITGITMSLVSLAQIVGITRPTISLGDSWGFLVMGICIAPVGYGFFTTLLAVLMKRRWSDERRFRTQSRAWQLALSGAIPLILAGAIAVSVGFWELGGLAGILGTSVAVFIMVFSARLYVLTIRELRRPFREIVERAEQEEQKATAAREKARKTPIPWWQIILFDGALLIGGVSALYATVRALSILLGISSPSPDEENNLFSADPWIYFFLAIGVFLIACGGILASIEVVWEKVEKRKIVMRVGGFFVLSFVYLSFFSYLVLIPVRLFIIEVTFQWDNSVGGIVWIIVSGSILAIPVLLFIRIFLIDVIRERRNGGRKSVITRVKGLRKTVTTGMQHP